MAIEKLSAGAKKLYTLFKVLQRVVGVCMIVVLCVLTVLTIANAVNPDIVIGTELNVLELGNISIELAEEFTPDNGRILGYAWIYAGLGVVCAAIIYIALGYVRKVLRPMTEGSPFHPDTARYFKKLAVLSLVLGVVQNAGGITATAAALHSFGLDKLLESDVIRSVTVNYELELGFLLLFFVLLLMSYLFSYGAQLQELSDETL